MGIADDMIKITEDIVTSYDVRVKALGDLVADTHKTLEGFASERKKMSKEQLKALSAFVSDLTRSVGDLLDELKNARVNMSVDLRTKLEKEVKDLKNYTKNRLKEFSDEHADMSKELRESLSSYVYEISKGVTNLLNEYSSDMKKAKVSWKGMSKTLKKARKAGVMVKGEQA